MKRLMTALLIMFVLLFVGCAGEEEAPAQAQTAPDQAAEAASEAPSVRDAVFSYFAQMPGHIYKVPQDEMVQMVAQGSEMTILDIRRPDDYATGHLIGAVNMPWGSPAMYELLPRIPTDRPVFVTCYSGQTAGQAVALLNIAGVEARSVNLGWNFGLSRVEGMQEFVETTPNELPMAEVREIPENIMTAYREYYEGTAAASGTPFASNIVSEQNAKAILDAEDPDVYWLSVRRAEHFAEAHIEGAVNIPFGAGMEEQFASLPADKKIIVYCYTGQTAGQTVAALRLLGFDAVSLKGGMGMPANEPLGWLAHGYPTVSS